LLRLSIIFTHTKQQGALFVFFGLINMVWTSIDVEYNIVLIRKTAFFKGPFYHYESIWQIIHDRDFIVCGGVCAETDTHNGGTIGFLRYRIGRRALVPG